jgi:hypothetical protein
MPETVKAPACQTIRHPRTADKDLTRFRRVLGSIALRGPVPSKKFLDDRTERPTRRARR